MVKIAKGPIRWFLLKRGFAGITLPPFGIYILKENESDKMLIDHEYVHWKQYERMGAVKFYVKYLYYSMRYGYWNNPMEKEARRET